MDTRAYAATRFRMGTEGFLNANLLTVANCINPFRTITHSKARYSQVKFSGCPGDKELMGGWYFLMSRSLIWTNSSGVIMAFASIACAVASVDWYSFSLRNIASFTGNTFLRPKPRMDIAGVGAILPVGVTIRLKCTSAAQAGVTVFFLVGQQLRVLVPPS